jgi:hypothetical protein
MKWMTWILLIANLAVAGFFFWRDYWPQAASDQSMPMNVERLRLRSQAASGEQKDAPQPRVPESEALCVEWRSLNRDEFVKVRDQLKAMAGERVMSFTEVPLETRYWVVFPPLPSPESAVAKLNELVAAGLTDVSLVKDGDSRNAISLGLYTSDEAARRRVRELEDKGVLGTRIEVQPLQGANYYFVIRSDDPDALKNLGEIKQAYPS